MQADQGAKPSLYEQQNEVVLVMMSDDDGIKQMRGMSVCYDFFAYGRACIHGLMADENIRH